MHLHQLELASPAVGKVGGAQQRTAGEHRHEQPVEGAHVVEVELPAPDPAAHGIEHALRLADLVLELALHLGHRVPHLAGGDLVRGRLDDQQVEADGERRERQGDQGRKAREQRAPDGRHAFPRSLRCDGRTDHARAPSPVSLI
ncbi:hypothetical protein D3C83_03460 [compost metagenome]